MMVLKLRERAGGSSFLVIVVILFLGGSLVYPAMFYPTLGFAWGVAKKIIPVLLLVLGFMALINYFLSPKKIVKYFGEKKSVKGWLIAIGGGILSTGPIYMWYPLLKDLRAKGMRYGFIAVFLYNRAIKIPLLPILILYFGVKFVVVLTLVMIIASVIQGLIIEKIIKL